MLRRSSYDKYPVVQVSQSASECDLGWASILERIRPRLQPSVQQTHFVLCLECYPGCRQDEIQGVFEEALKPALIVRAQSTYRTAGELNAYFDRDLGGTDPVFGRMNNYEIEDFFDPVAVARARDQIASTEGLVLVIGTGAAMLAPEHDLLVYADMARWEIQMRQRRGEIGNLGMENLEDRPALKYRRAFFLDWRVADRLKRKLFERIDFLLDTNQSPKMVSGGALRSGLRLAVQRPFRVVPLFDPGPWGGQWVKEVCDLPREAQNYAWCFDCVPEENSLLLGFGDVQIEIPAIDLVFEHPQELLGEAVHARFGPEFPIRFDFLDTMGGGNLSFQVHPLTEFMQEKFGMAYTQDESYYLLDAGPDACVYLGLKEGIDREEMAADLGQAQQGKADFDADLYANRFQARRHDHFLIPAGTPHCSGLDSMVLEISATPYIFTFKMWDWGRLGLDGRPRPIHLDYGLANIQWGRTTGWCRDNLVNRVEQVARGPGWSEERTGLHEREFIETRRHWFTGPVPHNTGGGVNVLNLVEGEEAIVESPTANFPPFVVHFAETFIIPAAVGSYVIRPHGPSEGKGCATMKAFVRTNA